MMNKLNMIPILFLLVTTVTTACTTDRNYLEANPALQVAKKENHPAVKESATLIDTQRKERVIEQFQAKKPQHWGAHVPGVINRLPTEEKVIALTFDACGGKYGSEYDQKLIDYLIEEKIPATLFVNSRWIDANHDTFLSLAKNPLFEIENHGYQHRPLSVTGKSIYGIHGTENAEEVIDEVMKNNHKISEMTGQKPKFFRSGTAYYDEVAVQIVHQLGVKVVNFDIVGDGGATFSGEQVRQALLKAKPGSIVILHFNQPGSGTAEGVMKAIPELKKQGFRFVKLEDYL